MTEISVVDQVVQRQDKDGMLRRALERIIQLYTDKSHFIYELLQNAEDAGATKIKFEQYEDRLVVLHNGHPFSLENLQGLCDIGKSDKMRELNQIGEFGVGFKSVFGICETVYLYSHPNAEYNQNEYQRFAVKIKDFTNPIETADKDFDTGYTTMYVFPYAVGLSFSSFQGLDKLNEVLSRRLQNLGITTLLFMKNLKSIDYKIELPQLKTTGFYSLDKKNINDHCCLVSAMGETEGKKEEEQEEKKEEKISYLVFSQAVSGVQSNKTIDIAFEMRIEDNGAYTFLPSSFPYISVYFPTETESKLKFIVQGPFRTTPNRSSVPSDNKDNINLAKQTAELLRDSVLELRDSGKLNYSLLNILPLSQDAFSRAPLFECVYSEMKELATNENIFLYGDGNYAKADSVKLSRGVEFAKILSEDLLTELINDGKEYHWLPTWLTETNRTYRPLLDFLTSELHIEVIRPENLQTAINKNHNFLRKRDDKWLIRFYNMYANVGNAFSKQKSGTKNMLTAEFIKTSRGKFVAPYIKVEESDENEEYYREYRDLSYRPNVFLPCDNMEDLQNISFVNKKIFQQCKHFFVDILGLEKPNEYEFFIRDFKKRYQEGQEPTDAQHFTDIKQLINFRKNYTYQNEVDSLIQQYIRLKCIKDKKTVYVNPSKELVFFAINSNNMSIEQYYLHIESYPYVDLNYYESGDINREMLSTLGVSEEIVRDFDIMSGEYYVGNRGRQPEWSTSWNFRWKLNLDKIGDVLRHISSHPHSANSMAKSSFIFHFLQINERYLKGKVHISGITPDEDPAYSSIVSELRNEHQNDPYHPHIDNWNGKWLYTDSEDLVSQREITKEELNTSLYGELKEESDLYEILGFRKDKEERRIEAQEKYDQLDKETKDQYFEMEVQRRYHMSSKDLDKRFGGKETDSYIFDETGVDYFEFPSSNVKNWDSLRKHAAEALSFASPLSYQYKIRRVRVSRPDNEIDAYLRSMYKIEGTYQYACQMCHDPFSNIVKSQIYTGMEKELDAMYLCLCPNCAAKYRNMRSDQTDLNRFLLKIENLTEADIVSQDPVKIEFGDESIWFTQTHIAEIKELVNLKNEADKAKGLEETEALEDDEEEGVIIGADTYKEYIGKKVKHKTLGIGLVKNCDEKHMYIEFEKGKKAGQEIKFQFGSVLDFIEIIDDD